MKKSLIIVILILIVLGSAIWFLIFRKAGRYDVMQGVPVDAVFVVQTPSFNSIHERLRSNRIWASLKAYPYFEAYHSDLERADSICDAYPVLKGLLTDRPIVVSCHPVSSSAYDFLYICDLGKLNVIQTLDGTIGALLKNEKMSFKKKGDMTEIGIGDLKFNYCIKDNLLLASMSEELVRRAADGCGQGEKIKHAVTGGDLMLSLNHGELDHFLGTMFNDPESAAGDSSALETTSLALNLSNDAIAFKGETLPNRKNFSLLGALNLMEGAKSEVRNIAGNGSAAYVSLCYGSFKELENILLENYKVEHFKEFSDYEKNLNRLNKFLGLNVVDVFTSWIGNEISFIKPGIDNERRLDEIVIAIRSKDIDLAKDQLAYLAEQIERKTPVRFRSIEYNGHQIGYLSMKGFFNLFLGGWFKKLEKPYFTFIEDYVVFSNSPATLASMIKDYSLGNTLANDEKYKELMDGFGKGNSVYGYINSPAAYEYLYNFFKPEERGKFVKNRGAFESFENIGFVLANAGAGFETRIVARYNQNASEEYKVRELNRQVEELVDRVESGYYNPTVPDSIAVSTRGDYRYATELLSFDGKLSDGAPDGVWNVHDDKGRLAGQVTCRAGQPHGEACFFYPGGTVQARLTYEKGKITTYREFFPDGTLKMEVEYNKGVRHGDVKFYYSTGHLYGEGKYKKGKRAGTWKYYRVTGEEDRKVKF